jgi:hypothetical protein
MFTGILSRFRISKRFAHNPLISKTLPTRKRANRINTSHDMHAKAKSPEQRRNIDAITTARRRSHIAQIILSSTDFFVP